MVHGSEFTSKTNGILSLDTGLTPETFPETTE
jgi:hypothetical protein